MASELAGVTKDGVKSQQHRCSRYHDKFIAKRDTHDEEYEKGYEPSAWDDVLD